MKKIFIDQHQYPPKLYTLSVRRPSKVAVQMLLGALGAFGLGAYVLWALDTWPEEAPVVIVISAILGLLSLAGAIAFLLIKADDLFSEGGVRKKLVHRRLLDPFSVPPGFQPEFIDTDEYQRVLTEWMYGYDIEPLDQLNDLLRNKAEFERKNIMEKPKSNIVSTEIESLKVYLGEDKQ